jgi:alkylation response protein AidB-like acyl-CoA dehydrogenase
LVRDRDYSPLADVRTVTGMSMTMTSTTTTTDWVDHARQFGSELSAGVAERDQSGELSIAAFDRLRAEGFTAALVPDEFGGGGATHAELGQVLGELARHDAATALALSMHSHLVAAQVWRQRHGIDAEPVLRKIAGGAVLVSTGASDWLPSNGTATRVDGGYRVSATKTPASGCEVGDVLVTSIRFEGGEEGPQVLHFSVPFTAEGVSVKLTWDTLGMRASGSHTVVLENVFVPDAAVSLVRPADVWHPVWATVLGAALPLIMSVYDGIAGSAADTACGLLAGRTEPTVHQLVGEMLNARTAAADALAAMFADSDDLQFANTEALASRMLIRKTAVATAAIDTVRLAIEAVGGSAFSRGGAFEQMYRDVHGALFHPLPRARQTAFTGRQALGLGLG